MRSSCSSSGIVERCSSAIVARASTVCFRDGFLFFFLCAITARLRFLAGSAQVLHTITVCNHKRLLSNLFSVCFATFSCPSGISGFLANRSQFLFGELFALAGPPFNPPFLPIWARYSEMVDPFAGSGGFSVESRTISAALSFISSGNLLERLMHRIMTGFTEVV